MANFLTGQKPPTKQESEVLDVLYPRPGQALEVTVCDHSFFGLHTHWFPASFAGEQNRSRLHSDREDCDGCQRGLKVGFCAYAGCYQHSRRRFIVVQLSAAGVESVCRTIPAGQQLRGHRVILTRASEHKSSVVVAQANPVNSHRQTWPAVDIMPTLRSLYGDDPRIVTRETSGSI